jgi:hypothetical protein
LTSTYVGSTAEYRVDGSLATAGVVREPITGGAFQLSGSLTEAVATSLAEQLSKPGARIEAAISKLY